MNKFVKETTGEGLTVPPAALKLCGVEPSQAVELWTTPQMLAILKKEMTALELLRALNSTMDLTATLLERLTEACGPCVDCMEECPMAAYQGGPLVRVSRHALEEAGIAPGGKLCCLGLTEGKAVLVTPAEYRHDLSDIPPPALSLLMSARLCMDQLNDYIMEEAIIYGQ